MRTADSLLVCVLLLSACGQDPQRSATMQSYLEAVALQESGSLEAALSAYQRLLEDCDDRNIRAKAELGQAQIELAFESRDRALLQLRALPDQTDHRSLESVEEQINGIVTGFIETPFETELRAAAHAARLRAAELHGRRRRLELDVVQNLAERGQFGAALETLRGLETGRRADDRKDIAEMLVRLRQESDRSAELLLAEFESLREQQIVQAAALLDEQMPRFTGTRAHARLLEARLQIASKVPLEPPEDEDETPPDDQQP